MKLREILTIPGMPGLYKLVATAKNNIIIESLIDGKRQSVAATHKVSSLGDINIFTTEEEMPLGDVLKKINETDGEKLSVDPKAEAEALKNYFRKLIPEIDEERVHTSHMKKILTWYDILKDKVDFAKLEEDEGEDKSALPEGGEKTSHSTSRLHETHAPKADQHAKVAPVKLRKKV
jgi:hypothetical protein